MIETDCSEERANAALIASGQSLKARHDDDAEKRAVKLDDDILVSTYNNALRAKLDDDILVST